MAFSISIPNRVSRLYPLFSLVLALSTSIFFFAWQNTQIELNRIANVEQHQKETQALVDSLTSEHALDKATLQVQTQKIADATSSLAKIQQQLESTNKQLVIAQAQVKQQQDQLSKNASQIDQLNSRPPLFSFQNSSSLSNVTQKETDVKALITNAYSYIQNLYGKPYLLNSITITFVNSFDIANSAGEIVIKNSSKGIDINIHLKDFDKNSFQDNNTVIHEMIHGFHGVAVMESSAYEEGMTVAATDAVMAAMISDGKLPHFSHLYLNITDQQYATDNTTLRILTDNQAFYNDPEVATVYQLIGTAWYWMYKEDPNFFKNLNSAYYAKVQQGIRPDDAVIRETIRQVLPSIKGQSIDSYLAINRAFNPT